MLLNLLSNAIKFTGRDGSILILVELLKQDLTNSNYLRISVIDTGIGIKKPNQEKIF